MKSMILEEETNKIPVISTGEDIDYIINERDKDFEAYMDKQLDSSEDPLVTVLEWSVTIAYEKENVLKSTIDTLASEEVFEKIIGKYFKNIKASNEFLNLLRYIYYDYLFRHLRKPEDLIKFLNKEE